MCHLSPFRRCAGLQGAKKEVLCFQAETGVANTAGVWQEKAMPQGAAWPDGVRAKGGIELPEISNLLPQGEGAWVARTRTRVVVIHPFCGHALSMGQAGRVCDYCTFVADVKITVFEIASYTPSN